MSPEDAQAELAARYNCRPEDLLEENEMLWDTVIELFKAIAQLEGRDECADVHSIGRSKLQLLKSYLRVRRFQQ